MPFSGAHTLLSFHNILFPAVLCPSDPRAVLGARDTIRTVLEWREGQRDAWVGRRVWKMVGLQEEGCMKKLLWPAL